jgi:hypothetical protein
MLGVRRLIVGAAEFRTQSDNRMKSASRPEAPEVVSQGRQYKAIVFIYMNGAPPRVARAAVGQVATRVCAPRQAARTPPTCSPR